MDKLLFVRKWTSTLVDSGSTLAVSKREGGGGGGGGGGGEKEGEIKSGVTK